MKGWEMHNVHPPSFWSLGYSIFHPVKYSSTFANFSRTLDFAREKRAQNQGF